MQNTRKLKVTDLNPQLICVLCGGYYIDATTIIECFHSFCRSCIVRYLESNKYCPICDVQVHKTRPLQNIRPDTTLQTIVYKLVPGLYQNEMRCRREFYAKHPEAKVQAQSPEARGELTDQSPIFLPDDQISICLEYMDSSELQQGTYGRRYLRCPAAVTVLHLHKLIRAKFGLTSHKVDVMYKEDILLENWTLMDVAYIYQWRRKCPIHLTYRILEIRRKRMNVPIETGQSSASESTAAKTPRKENDTSVCSANQQAASDLEKCPTYQLRISENGVMSVAGIENANRLLAPPQLVNVDDFESSVVKETIVNNKNSSETPSKTEVNVNSITTAKDSTSIPTSNSSSLTTSSKSSSSTSTTISTSTSTSTTTSTSTSTSSSEAQAVTSSAVGDNRTKISESVDSPKTALNSCSVKSLVQTQTSNNEPTKPKDNNNVSNVKSANKPTDSIKVGKMNVSIKADANCREDNSLSKEEASIRADSVSNSKKNTSRETTKDEAPTKLSKDISSNLVDIFACDPPRPPNTHKVYPGVKATSTPITAPLAKDDSSKQNIQKTNAATQLKPTPMEILNAAVPKKTPNNSASKYKTLKSPTTSWNPTIPRSTILSMKHSPAAVNQSKDPNPVSGSDVANPPPAKQPKFFKQRNMPRFLGNPASGVKPMYQVAPGTEIVSQNPSTGTSATASVQKSAKTTNSSITLMKIDPKTLCPIPVNPVSHVLSSPPKTTSSPPPKKLPPPYTPGSPKTTNHYTSARTVHSNASATKSPVPRIPSPAHTGAGALMPSNPFMHSNPHLLYGAFSAAPFAASDPTAPNTQLIRAMSALGAAYHPSLPPSISMLFNPHHPHHRLTQVDRAAFKTLTEDKQALPSPPAVQRIPPSKGSSDPSTSQANSTVTKKEKVDSDRTRTSPVTTDQPKKMESAVDTKPPPVSEPESKPAPSAADSKSEAKSLPKSKSVENKVNVVDGNSESKLVSNDDSKKISNSKSTVNINSRKAEKSSANEKKVDCTNLKEKKEIPKNNNYTNKASSFPEGTKGNIMISTESSLKA
ncbi:protein suppressor 2 of zeste [Nilaparvata lugens]|uniref:protein suppressor 2 of zeste n=1 Tax=Nilaparvata lugens TaxID=108931 RepID=UPI00193CF7E7|nr:protein suppressor 2 of zeste [Nilaparvata lugens]XP_022186266.2 protein suppressor 2 of zeste [Nilaparvata lugens]